MCLTATGHVKHSCQFMYTVVVSIFCKIKRDGITQLKCDGIILPKLQYLMHLFLIKITDITISDDLEFLLHIYIF